ncbi:MAG: PKD domain-containing protein [Thermoplasmata archaeon]|nr:PKD domain-containing protein [Thermoplasmata archaeon]
MRPRPSLALLVGLAVVLVATGPLSGAPSHPAPPTPSGVRAGTSWAPAPAVDRLPSGQVNWATYLGSPEHTGDNPLERAIAPSNVSNLTPEFTFEDNGSDLSAPIVVNGTLYFGSWAGYEYAINAANGSQIWDSYLGNDPDCYVGGIESTPSYSNGTLYLGAPNGSWDALNASNGSLDWSYFLANSSIGNFDWASAEMYGHSLYIGEASCEDAPLVSGRLVQVNLTGNHTANHTWNAAPGVLGTTIWTTATVDPATDTLWSTTGNDNGIAQTYAQSVVALNASTLTVEGFWQVPNVVGEDEDFGSTATLVTPAHGPPLIVSTNKNGVTYAFNRSNVTDTGWGPAWADTTGGGWSSAAYDGTNLYVAGAAPSDSGTLFAIDPSNGSIVWQTALPSGYPYAAVTVANGLVYVGAYGTEYAIDATYGTILWSVNVPVGNDVYGEAVVADGRLYVPSGAPSQAAGEIQAFGLPMAAFGNGSLPNASNPQVAQFCANVTGGMAPFTFDWTFDDNGTAVGPCVEHTFQFAGIHVGNVSVRDAAGELEFVDVQVTTTGPAPVFHVGIRPSALAGEAPLRIWCNATEVNGTGPTFTWNWSFGDGTYGTGASVSHTYEAGGTFHIDLNATDAVGHDATAAEVANILPPLATTVGGGPLSGTIPLTTDFSASPSGGLAPYTVSWSFGDGSTPTLGNSASHTYEATGNFTANATITDALGFVTGGSVVVEATSAPPGSTGMPLVAHPTSTLLARACNPATAQLEFSANASGGVAPLSERWTFGDGSADGTGAIVVHSYAAGIRYNASVTIDDSNGSSLSLPIPVYATPANCSSTVAAAGIPAETLEIVGIVAVAAIVVLTIVLLFRRRQQKP